MTDLAQLAAQVTWPDHAAGTLVYEQLAGQPAFGRLADLAQWVATVQPTPADADADHPSADDDGAGAFARVRTVVVGAPSVSSSAAAAAGPDVAIRAWADLPDTVDAALAAGVAAADAEIDHGADLLVLAAPLAGVAAAIVVSVLADAEPVKVLARGVAATDPDAWMSRAIEVRDGRRACVSLRSEPDRLLAALDSPTLAATTGFVLAAAARRTPVLFDGPAAAAAALLAYEAQPQAVRWWCAADSPADPGQEIALDRLALRPVLALGCALADATAGALAVPVLQAAARLANTTRQAAQRPGTAGPEG